jgi:predicted HNH restriction endonuclease
LITSRVKYCKKCRALLYKKDLTYAEITKNAKYQKNAWIRDKARRVMKNLGIQKICRNCGYDKHVVVCHIKPISSFSEHSKISEINSTANLVYLCPNCHWELDNGLVKIS